MSEQLQETITPKGRTYYLNGVRVSKAAYDAVRNSPYRSGSCFQTVTKGDTIRHYSVWYLSKL